VPADDLDDLDDLDGLGDLDGELERLIADDLGDLDEPVPYGSRAPSGELSLDLDIGTADAAHLSDESLVEAIVGSTGSPLGRRPAKRGCSTSWLRAGRRTGRRYRRGGRVWVVSTPPTRSG